MVRLSATRDREENTVHWAAMPVRTHRGGILIAQLGFVASVALLPLSTRAADVALHLTVERKPVTLLRGTPASPDTLFLDMVTRTVGRTEFSLSIPSGIRYTYSLDSLGDGAYRIAPGSLHPAAPFSLTGRVKIQYPKLSDAQFNTIRNHADYRFVYGFINGVVRHEEGHAKEFVRFLKTVRALYASPPIGDRPIRPRPGESPSAAASRVLNTRLQDAVASARRAMTTVQSQIDHTGKTTHFEFAFTESATGGSGPTIVYDTEGRLTVNLAVPNGNPRPAEARTKY